MAQVLFRDSEKKWALLMLFFNCSKRSLMWLIRSTPSFSEFTFCVSTWREWSAKIVSSTAAHKKEKKRWPDYRKNVQSSAVQVEMMVLSRWWNFSLIERLEAREILAFRNTMLYCFCLFDIFLWAVPSGCRQYRWIILFFTIIGNLSRSLSYLTPFSQRQMI